LRDLHGLARWSVDAVIHANSTCCEQLML
jgi:hypothetical protein